MIEAIAPCTSPPPLALSRTVLWGMKSNFRDEAIASPFETLAVALIAYEQLTQDRQE